MIQSVAACRLHGYVGCWMSRNVFHYNVGVQPVRPGRATGRVLSPHFHKTRPSPLADNPTANERRNPGRSLCRTAPLPAFPCTAAVGPSSGRAHPGGVVHHSGQLLVHLGSRRAVPGAVLPAAADQLGQRGRGPESGIIQSGRHVTRKRARKRRQRAANGEVGR